MTIHESFSVSFQGQKYTSRKEVPDGSIYIQNQRGSVESKRIKAKQVLVISSPDTAYKADIVVYTEPDGTQRTYLDRDSVTELEGSQIDRVLWQWEIAGIVFEKRLDWSKNPQQVKEKEF